MTAASRIRLDPRFAELEKKRATFAWTLTIVMLVIYFGYIALIAFSPATIAVKVVGSITVGLFLGIAVILSAIILTGVYVVRANGEFDRLSRDVVNSIQTGVVR